MKWTGFKVACLKHSKFAENNELSKEAQVDHPYVNGTLRQG